MIGSEQNLLWRRRAHYAVAILMMRLLLGHGTRATAASLGITSTQHQPGAAQSTSLEEATRLNKAVVSLYHVGRYGEAIPLAERALRIREEEKWRDKRDRINSWRCGCGKNSRNSHGPCDIGAIGHV